ncbi:MAG: peptidase M20 family hydrolase [Chloroflexi bacterium]|nr:MAG: peptidase M20 family hydrolase [Chloroflexota bacterium]
MNQISDETVESVIRYAGTIQQIASPTFEEQHRAQFMLDEFQKNGLKEVHQDIIGNVFGKIPGGKSAPLVISAHLDSVFSIDTPLTLQRFERQLQGPGIGDNALGLASLLCLAKHLISNNLQLPGEIWFIANVREEGLGNLLGMRQVVERFKNSPVAYISLEGVGLGYIQNRALAVQRIRVEVKTKGGHSWVNYGNPSAIHEITKIASNLTSFKLPEFPRTIFNIGTIHGGESINSVAPYAAMEIDIRSEDHETLSTITEIVKNKCIQGRTEGVQIIITDIGSRESGTIPENHPLIQTAQKALRHQGITPVLVISSTDASLPISLGYSATSLGITTGKNIHSIHETIDLGPIPQGLTQILCVIDEIWSVNEKG